ncbi:hypothetical protein SK128_009795 [Halocaridina rubra]|uniref:Caspase family p20 domain-containing protein n=1 Tax=Halocaridina rubra TaxID=373956 RepID=A0AAN9A9W6_HALRR
MEYIAAMNFELDDVIPVQDLPVTSLFTRQQSKDDLENDDFISDINREMMDVSLLTELGTLPYLIKRNSSKMRFEYFNEEKENGIKKCSKLSRRNSEIRSNSQSMQFSEMRRDGSFSDNVKTTLASDKEPLQSISITRSSSQQNSLLLERRNEYISQCTRDQQEKESLNCEDVPDDKHGNSRETKEREETLNIPEIESETIPIQDLFQNLSGATQIQEHKETSASSNSEESVANECYDEKSTPAKAEHEVENAYSLAPDECYEVQLSSSLTQMEITEEFEDNSLNTTTGEEAPAIEKEIQGSIHNNPAPVTGSDTLQNQNTTVKICSDTESTCEMSDKKASNDHTENLVFFTSNTNQMIDYKCNEDPVALARNCSVPIFKENQSPLQISSSNSSFIHTNKRSRSPSPVDNTCASKIIKKSFNHSSYSTVKQVTSPDSKFTGKPSVSSKNQKTPSPKRLSLSPIKSRSSLSSCCSLSKLLRKDNTVNRRASWITRGSTARLMQHIANHSGAHIAKLKTKLVKAVQEGNVELVSKMMCDTGATIRIGKTYSTLLHIAAASNQSEMVLHLLKLISPNVINKQGQTPAHFAALKGHTQILRILLKDNEFIPRKLDRSGRTFTDYLVSPLFEAVLQGNKGKVNTLTELGANLDCHAGESVDGILSRELNVTSVRHLAKMLYGDELLTKNMEVNHKTGDNPKLNQPNLKQSRYFAKAQTNTKLKGPAPNTKGGYACILHFNSFCGRPELERKESDREIKNLTKVLREMGYSGHVHTSLTAEQLKMTLESDSTKKMLLEAECAIFVISSHSMQRDSFLTSDLKVLTTDWLMKQFNNSNCSQLQNKPKLFVFDLHTCEAMKTLHLEQDSMPLRMEEPLHGTMCLYSESNGQPQFFMECLRQTLKNNSRGGIEDQHRDILRRYCAKYINPSPELRNIGFTKKFYLNLSRS